MGYDRSFRFANDELNRRLVAHLRETAVAHAVRADGGVDYYSTDEERVEDALAGVRGGVFPDWQVLSFPPGWADRYRSAMAAHGAEFEEEVHNGEVEFLLAGHHEPHAWEVG